MSASLNKVQLIGNVGAEPTIRYFPDGKATATVSVATSETWKDKASGEKKERTEWHRVVFFGGLAEVVRDYIKSGSQIYVEGPQKTRAYKDAQGVEKYITEVIGKELKMLGKKTMPAGATPPASDVPASDDDGSDDVPF